jgi:MFS family permease
MVEVASAPWQRIVLIYLIGVFGMLVVSSAVPALGGIAEEFRPPSPATIGWVMSMPALAAAVSSLCVGWLVDRFGDRPMMVIGAILVILGDVGVVTAHGMNALLACRVVGGLGYVCLVVGAVTMITRLTEGRQRTAALALWSTVIPASFILASLYGLAVGPGAGWRMVFVAHAVGTGVLVLIGRVMLPAPVTVHGAARTTGLAQVLRTPWPFVLGMSFAAAAFLQTGFVASLPGMLESSIGVTVEEVHSFNILAMLCNVAGAFSFGLLYNRGMRPVHMGLGAVAACTVAGSVLVLAPTDLMVAMAMNCLLMAGLGVLVGMWSLLPLVAPSPACMGATSGLITQVTLLGVLFGPPAAFAARFALPHGSMLFLGFGVVLSLIAWPIWRRETPAFGGPTPTAH